MKKNFKKTLLAIVMCATLLSVSVLAASAKEEYKYYSDSFYESGTLLFTGVVEGHVKRTNGYNTVTATTVRKPWATQTVTFVKACFEYENGEFFQKVEDSSFLEVTASMTDFAWYTYEVEDVSSVHTIYNIRNSNFVDIPGYMYLNYNH